MKSPLSMNVLWTCCSEKFLAWRTTLSCKLALDYDVCGSPCGEGINKLLLQHAHKSGNIEGAYYPVSLLHPCIEYTKATRSIKQSPLPSHTHIPTHTHTQKLIV